VSKDDRYAALAELWAGGIRWPSVTEVIALAGISKLPTSVSEQVLAKAGERGKAVHEWTHVYDLTGERPPDMNPCRGYVDGWARFRDETGFTPELIEEPLASNALRFVGTLDRAGTMQQGERWVFDLKAVAEVAWWTGLQLAGYELLLSNPHQRAAVQLFPEGRYKLVAFPDREDTHDFLAALRVCWAIKRHEEE